MNERALIPIVVIAGLLATSHPAFGEPPDPAPGATLPVREQNLDGNGWIAVHEQGVADVTVTNTAGEPIPVEVQGVADVNVAGGSVEAEITGGEVEVTNEVTVTIPEDEVINVDVLHNSYRFNFWNDDLEIHSGEAFDVGYQIPAGKRFHVEHTVCEAESTYSGLNDDLFVRFYHGPQPESPEDLNDLIDTWPLKDVCAPFTEPYYTGSLMMRYQYFCKSDSHWIAPGHEWKIVMVRGGNPFAPLDSLRCHLQGYLSRE